MFKEGLYTLGHFNDDLLSTKNKLSGIIINNTVSLGYTNARQMPTRVTPTAATLLDLIITNTPDNVLTKSVVPQVIADHDLIRIKLTSVSRGYNQIAYRHLRS